MNSTPQDRPSGAPRGSKPGGVYASRRLAALYELWGSLTESRASARALAVADPQPGESLLEVAVGTGALLAQFAARQGLERCIGMELAGPMLERARRRLRLHPSQHTAICQADARRLPFQAATFDVAVNCYMLDLLPEIDIVQVLREFRQVLKPGGRLVLLVMARQSWLVQRFWMFLYSLSPALVGGCRPVPTSEFLAGEGWRIELAEEISQSGFRSELVLARPGP